ncbi:MAG: hypothetical protein L6R28_12030 [Planctomycetes bacterium]|nr:hypothetical protein [Planctomycetota bacterium]
MEETKIIPREPEGEGKGNGEAGGAAPQPAAPVPPELATMSEGLDETKAIPPAPKPGALNLEQSFWKAAAALMLALAFLTVSGCFNAPFLSYDDVEQVSKNPVVAEGKSLFAGFFEFHYAQYVPVTLASFKLNFDLFGREAAWSFRAGNLLLHACSGLLIMALFVRLGLKRLEAMVLAMAWVAHPMACESVGWITERSNCLAAFFGLLGLYAYVRWYADWAGVLGGAGGFLLAVLSKPAALGFLPIFVAVDLLGGPDKLKRGNMLTESGGFSIVGNQAGAFWRLLPLVLVAGVLTWVGIERHKTGLMPPPGGHWYTALLTDVEIFARYLSNILAPYRLSAFYHVRDIESLADPRVYTFGAVLVLLVVMSTAVARSRRRAAFGWLWFFGGLATNSNIVAIDFLMQDRYAYLASIGVLLVVVETVLGIADRVSAAPAEHAQPRPVLAVLAGLFIAMLGFFSAQRSVLWANEANLFEHATRQQPGSAFGHLYLMTVLDTRGYEVSKATVRTPDEEAMREKALEEIRTRILAEFNDARGCSDYYRHHAPFEARLTAARNARDLGKLDLARDLLGGFLPPPPPPEGWEERLREGDVAGGLRGTLLGPEIGFGHVYVYYAKTLCSAYDLMAECDLDAFQQATLVADGNALLDRAEGWVEKSVAARLEIAGGLAKEAERYRTMAADYRAAARLESANRLVKEGERYDAMAADYRAATASPACIAVLRARDALKLAQERGKNLAAAFKEVQEALKRLRPTIDEYRGALLPPPRAPEDWLPAPERLLSVALLAEGEARLEGLKPPPGASEKDPPPRLSWMPVADLIQELCNRALELDPSCADAHFLLARLHLLLDRLCELNQDLAGSNEHFSEAVKQYNKISTSWYRYPIVQAHLSRLKPPKPLPKDDEKKVNGEAGGTGGTGEPREAPGKTELAPETKTEAAPEAKTEPAPDKKTEAAPEAKAEPVPETKTEAAPETKTEAAPAAGGDAGP